MIRIYDWLLVGMLENGVMAACNVESAYTVYGISNLCRTFKTRKGTEDFTNAT